MKQSSFQDILELVFKSQDGFKNHPPEDSVSAFKPYSLEREKANDLPEWIHFIKVEPSKIKARSYSQTTSAKEAKGNPQATRAQTSQQIEVPGPLRKKETRQTVHEPRVNLNELSTQHQVMIKRLIELGAEDLRFGYSPQALKSAYRLLAKRFHPDSTESAHSKLDHKREDSRTFREVYQIYSSLKKDLKL